MSDELETPQVPHDFDAERQVLAAALAGNHALGALIHDLGVRDDDFYAPDHRLLWRALRTCDATGTPVDVATVSDLIRRHPDWRADVDIDEQHVRLLVTGITTSWGGTPGPHHAEILRDLSERRRIAAAAWATLADVNRPERPAREILADAEQRLLRADDTGRTRLVSSAAEALDDAIRLWENPRRDRGLPTGFVDLDRIVRGMRPGQLVIIGARPAMGKSAFALDIARHVAFRRGADVLLASLEMPEEELIGRVAAAEASVPGERLDEGIADVEEMGRITALADMPHFGRLRWTDRSDLSVAEIASTARRVAARLDGGLDLLIVDYLQLIRPADPRAMPVHQVAQMSRDLKVLAGSLGCPVIALSQLSRANESRPNKRPVLSDLRDSGAIEQDADKVLFLHREDYYNDDADPGIADVEVAKNRRGSTGRTQLVLQATFPRFISAGRPNQIQPPPPMPPPGRQPVPLPDTGRAR